jgi:hypothetical protein
MITPRPVGSKALWGAAWGKPQPVTILAVVEEKPWCSQSHRSYYYVILNRFQLKMVTTEAGLSDIKKE